MCHSQSAVKLLLAGLIGRAGRSLSAFFLQSIGEQALHGARPRRVQLDRAVGIRPDTDSLMRLAIQLAGLLQEAAKLRRTARAHDFERDRLLHRRIQADQCAPVVGQEAFMFLFRLLADQGLGEGGQGRQESPIEGFFR